MMLTTKSRYAVMAVVDIAANAKNKPVNLADISQRQNIAQNYLEQIFLSLKNAGVVKSVRGPGGGYRFSKDIKNIKISNIIDAVGEDIEMTRCISENKISCMPQNIRCNSHFLWKGLSKIIRSYFENISICDVASGKIQEFPILEGYLDINKHLHEGSEINLGQ